MTQGHVAAYKGRLVQGFRCRDEDRPQVLRWDGRRLTALAADPPGRRVITLPAGRPAELARRPSRQP